MGESSHLAVQSDKGGTSQGVGITLQPTWRATSNKRGIRQNKSAHYLNLPLKFTLLLLIECIESRYQHESLLSRRFLK